jgi:pimeloyl-ACP methyl ester carboxylesterase
MHHMDSAPDDRADRAPAAMPEPPAMPEPTMVASLGVELAVYDFGGDGPALLFVHANGFCAAVWAPVISRLADHRCVAVDLRAHGRSRPHDGDPSWDRHGDDLLAVTDALGLQRAAGVGHSMGGAALMLAEQTRPGTFSSLWVWEPIVFPPVELPPEGNSLADGALRRRAEFPSEQAAFDELAPLALSAYVRHGFRQRTGGVVELRCPPGDESELYRQGPRHRAWEHLEEVRCPVTVLRSEPTGGGADLIAPLIADRIPGSTLEDHPELGHFGPLADFDTVAASIREHLRRADT